MPTPAETATEYFAAVDRHDLDRMGEIWGDGKVSRMVGMNELRAPDEVLAWFGNLFDAFPDFRLNVDEIVADGEKVVARWTATATFDGTGTFEGFKPNGAAIELEGMDLLTIVDGRIESLIAFLNGLDLARQLGAVPPQGSLPDRAMTAAFNAKTVIAARVRELAGSSRSRKG